MDATEQAYLEKRKQIRTGADSQEQTEPVEEPALVDIDAPIEEEAEVEQTEASD